MPATLQQLLVGLQKNIPLIEKHLASFENNTTSTKNLTNYRNLIDQLKKQLDTFLQALKQAPIKKHDQFYCMTSKQHEELNKIDAALDNILHPSWECNPTKDSSDEKLINVFDTTLETLTTLYLEPLKNIITLLSWKTDSKESVLLPKTFGTKILNMFFSKPTDALDAECHYQKARDLFLEMGSIPNAPYLDVDDKFSEKIHKNTTKFMEHLQQAQALGHKMATLSRGQSLLHGAAHLSFYHQNTIHTTYLAINNIPKDIKAGAELMAIVINVERSKGLALKLVEHYIEVENIPDMLTWLGKALEFGSQNIAVQLLKELNESGLKDPNGNVVLLPEDARVKALMDSYVNKVSNTI